MAHGEHLCRENCILHHTCRGDGTLHVFGGYKKADAVNVFVYVRGESFLFAPPLGRGVVCDGESHSLVDGGHVLWLGMKRRWRCWFGFRARGERGERECVWVSLEIHE